MKSSRRELFWRVEGPFDSSYSLALLNREIARALSLLGVKVALFSTEGPGDFEPSNTFLIENPDLDEMYQRSKENIQQEDLVASRNLYPPRVLDMTGSVNILHSYAWEETGFPAEWVKNFNQSLSGLTCLSSHVMKTMQDNGVGLPMSVAGCGVDHWERIVADSSYELEGDGIGSFRFLHVSSFFPRKGPDALLEGYGLSFTNDDDVSLIIKTFPNPHNNVHIQLKRMREMFPNYPHVVVIENDLNDAELKALYNQCDVLVAPSCAEGFGLPLAEAMLSGLPVITTAWSGQMDFCNDENSWLVDYKFEQAKTHFQLTPSAWAACDISGLSTAMLKAFSAKPQVRKAMADKGRELLLKDFTWAAVARRSLDYLTQLKKLPKNFKDINPRIGWVTTWGVKCGIATYSEHLMAGMQDKPLIFAANNKNLVRKDGDQVFRCWECDRDNLENLSKILGQNQVDVIVIQFNFGFFHQKFLHNFIEFQRKLGRLVIFDMHATENPPHAPDKNLLTYLPSLTLADKVLVHTIDDLNKLKAIGVVKNVAIFPHGILNIELSDFKPKQTPQIATYGFCLPHKGLLDVVQAISFLRDTERIVNLKMVNAIYPSDISWKLADEIKALMQQLRLNDQIEFKSDFLEDSSSINILQSCELIIFAYQPTTESASGAARYGFASGRPILVTDLPIFEEFGDSVWRTTNDNTQQLAEDIWSVLGHIRSSSEEFLHKAELSSKLRTSHSYDAMSRRLEGIAKSLYIKKMIHL